MKCHCGFSNGFLFGGFVLARFCYTPKKKEVSHNEGAKASDQGLLVYTVHEREEIKAFQIPLLYLVVCSSLKGTYHARFQVH